MFSELLASLREIVIAIGDDTCSKYSELSSLITSLVKDLVVASLHGSTLNYERLPHVQRYAFL
jgi:hypothetical protein